MVERLQSRPDSHTTRLRSVSPQITAYRTTEHWEVTKVITTGVIEITFTNMQNYADDGITENPCWPKTLISDPGFALFAHDPWYAAHAAALQIAQQDYRKNPGHAYTNGKANRPGYHRNKRGTVDEVPDPALILAVDGNHNRESTDEELFEYFGFLRCAGEDCEHEQDALGLDSLVVMRVEKISVAGVEAVDATASETILALPVTSSSPGGLQGAAIPLGTGAACPQRELK